MNSTNNAPYIVYTKESGRMALTEYQYFDMINKIKTLHREDGPSVELINGYRAWYINGKRHRTDGPAIINANGSKLWYKEGIHHRIDGPATVWPSGRVFWLIEDKEYSKEDFDKLIQEARDMPLVLRLIDPRKWVREYKS